MDFSGFLIFCSHGTFMGGKKNTGICGMVFQNYLSSAGCGNWRIFRFDPSIRGGAAPVYWRSGNGELLDII